MAEMGMETDEQAKEQTLGEIAYEAYCEASSGKSLISGESLPDWKDLADNIKDAWEAAGDAVAEMCE